MKGLKTPKRDKKPTQFHPQLIKLNPNWNRKKHALLIFLMEIIQPILYLTLDL
jgi:hypothetical protein